MRVDLVLGRKLGKAFLAVLFTANEGSQRSRIAHPTTTLAPGELVLERRKASATAEFRLPRHGMPPSISVVTELSRNASSTMNRLKPPATATFA
jgi:hypothetical protein